jgi:hypothetical protein
MIAFSSIAMTPLCRSTAFCVRAVEDDGLHLAFELDDAAAAEFYPFPKLDFIEKAVSSLGLDVKDCFLPEDLAGSFESELESSEVSEGAPAAPHAGPVE